MSASTAVINRIDTTPTTLRSALADIPAPGPWDTLPPKTQVSETIDKITNSFGLIVSASQDVSTALTNSVKGADYAEEALAFTIQMVEMAQEQKTQATPAPGRRYADVNAAKHTAKANTYTARAGADASLAETAAETAASYQALAETGCDQARRAAALVFFHSETLPQEYAESTKTIRHKTGVIMNNLTKHADDACIQSSRAHSAAQKARDAVRSL